MLITFPSKKWCSPAREYKKASLINCWRNRLVSMSISLDQAVAELLQQAGEQVRDKARNTTLFHTSSSFRDHINTSRLNSTTQIVISAAPWSSYLEEGNPFEGFIIT